MALDYTLLLVEFDSPLAEPWESPLWRETQTIELSEFHPASSPHRPLARAKLLYSRDALHLRFFVADRYVLSRHTQYQESVYLDSCVEFFVQPRGDGGYFNFEINCGGTLLLYYIEDATRTPDGFARFTKVARELGDQVEIIHSLPEVVFPEDPCPMDWQIACKIPRNVLEAYAGPLGVWAGQVWRANFYKCADESSHPHWASWAPIGEPLNFHQPSCFAPLRFATPTKEYTDEPIDHS
ncbi:MAG: carbohydrate-binding family 9-like protein [Planctomycetota bacterium]